jgi:hypothetical protein
MNKWNSMKLKSFCRAKETVTRLKRLPPELDKILAIYSFIRGLISRINRELKQLNSERDNIPMNKWAHELNKEFSREEVPIANTYMKKCSTFLIIMK